MERSSVTHLIGLIGAVCALVIGLHHIGSVPGLAVSWDRPIGWLRNAPPELVVGAILRQLGLVLGYWVLASTTAYAVTEVGNRPIRWVRFVTLPPVRRLVDRAVATSLTVSLLGSPLAPAVADAPLVFDSSDDGIPIPHVQVIETPPTDDPRYEPATHASISPIPEPPQSLGAPTVPKVPALPSEVAHVVVKGDNLWTIAASHLNAEAGSAVDSDCIAGYWREVIERNRTTLRSGDPNLIYPGEIITLPPLGAAS